MKVIDNKRKTHQVFKIIERELKKHTCLGKMEWWNPGGNEYLQTYSIINNEKEVWVATVIWCHSKTNKKNRYTLLSTFPTKGLKVGQILEISLPFYYSKVFITRLYEENNCVEIRNYGRFTVGHRGLKKVFFFDYLKDHGLSSEIKVDEEGEKYICIFSITNMSIDPQLFDKRIIELTHLIKGFKDKYRNEIDV